MEQEPSSLKLATGHRGVPGQGAFMNVTLTVEEETVREASFETYQCPGCLAFGKAIGELVVGKLLEEVKTVTHSILVEWVGPLAPLRRICYTLALLALANALEQLKTDLD